MNIDWTRMVTSNDQVANARAAWLSTARMPKLAFVQAVSRAGILSPADAVRAARGEWPEAMASFLPLLDEQQQTEALMEWAASVTVERDNVNLLVMASWLDLTEAAVDELFGIAVPVEAEAQAAVTATIGGKT